MRKIKIAFTATLMLVSAAANATIITGSKLAEYYSAYERVDQGRSSGSDGTQSAMFIGYVTGVADWADGAKIICLPVGANIRQIVAVVGNHLRANPDEWAWDGSMITAVALSKAFPCAK